MTDRAGVCLFELAKDRVYFQRVILNGKQLPHLAHRACIRAIYKLRLTAMILPHFISSPSLRIKPVLLRVLGKDILNP